MYGILKPLEAWMDSLSHHVGLATFYTLEVQPEGCPWADILG
jgi:hypothetical protein